MAIDVVAKYGLVLDGKTDNAAGLAKWAADLVATPRPRPRYVFTGGTLAYSAWPKFIMPGNTQIIADGECVLKCTGPGTGVTLSGESQATDPNDKDDAEKTWNCIFDGFTIVAANGNGLDIHSIHGSKINVIVEGTGKGKTGVYIYFSVLTDYWICVQQRDLQNGNRTGVGVVVDAEPGLPSQEASKNVFHSLNISGVDTGLVHQSGGMNDYMSGAIEGCINGFHGINGGSNHITYMDLEANSGYDLIIEKGFHDNLFFWINTQGKVQNNNLLGGNEFVPTWADKIGI
jgi:hypothetical protein